MAATTWSQLRCNGNISSLYRIVELLRQQDGRSHLDLDLVDQVKSPPYFIAKCKLMLNVQSVITFGEGRDPFAAAENAAVACLEILKGLARCDSNLHRLITYFDGACATQSYPPLSREIQRTIIDARISPSAPPLVESPKQKHDQH